MAFTTAALFERYYFRKPGYLSGTKAFFDFCGERLRPRASILEIGAGGTNNTSDYLATRGRVTGVDVSDEVAANRALSDWKLFNGESLPFEDNSFDFCCSNWVLEHVAKPVDHFREVCRVLKPGGCYCFRTLNVFHYVGVASRLSPHRFHKAVANRSRGLGPQAHDPWPTFYRCNSHGKVLRTTRNIGILETTIKMIEAEPSYGKASPLLFYPMLVWERAVNSTDALQSLRSTIIASITKPVAPNRADAVFI